MPITIIKKTTTQTAASAPATSGSEAETPPETVAEEKASTASEVAEPLPASFLSVAEAASYAGISKSTIRRWMEAKVFSPYRAGKQWRIDPKEIVSFMRSSAHCENP